jgi:lipoprotein-anchoring transpeptidase ErfK/SrfK
LELKMISRATVSRAVVATGAAVLAAVALSQNAAAEDPLFYVWGRDEPGESAEEGGGRRETVAFSPRYAPGQVIVSFGDRRLYLVTRRGQALSYPIAIPRDQSRWEGLTTVTMKRENPSWTPTEEMLRENPRLPSWVPGGHPLNPLGVRALYLGSSTYRIHGTDAPWTIGQAVSKGCIRMYNEDVLDLYPRVPVGARVTVTWQRFDAGEVASNDGSSFREDMRRATSRWMGAPRPRQRYVAAE